MTRSNHRARRRRVVFGVLVVLVGFLVASLWGAIHSSAGSSPVSFDVERITPNADAYCPGDTLTYSVTVTVDHPTVLEITETWCEKGLEGRCSAALSRTWK